MFFLKIDLVSWKVGWQTRYVAWAANSVTKIYHALPRTLQSSAWHWSRSEEASSGWFKGWMDLKGRPNGFKAAKAPDEKLPFSTQQTVFELVAASAPRYLWRGRCTGIRWLQVTIKLEKRLRKRWVWELSQKLAFDICGRCFVKLYQNVKSARPLHFREWARKSRTGKKNKTKQNRKTKRNRGQGAFDPYLITEHSGEILNKPNVFIGITTFLFLFKCWAGGPIKKKTDPLK